MVSDGWSLKPKLHTYAQYLAVLYRGHRVSSMQSRCVKLICSPSEIGVWSLTAIQGPTQQSIIRPSWSHQAGISYSPTIVVVLTSEILVTAEMFCLLDTSSWARNRVVSPKKVHHVPPQVMWVLSSLAVIRWCPCNQEHRHRQSPT